MDTQRFVIHFTNGNWKIFDMQRFEVVYAFDTFKQAEGEFLRHWNR